MSDDDEHTTRTTNDQSMLAGYHFATTTAREFVDLLLRGDWHRTYNRNEAVGPGTAGWIFRGQTNSTYPLLPTGFRDNTDWSLFADQPPVLDDAKAARHKYIASHLHAERRAVHLFLEAADRLGIMTPISYKSTPKENKILKKMFNGEECLPPAFPSQGRRAAFALAQHHGVPTRLLDWSESPLIAAFFAAHGAMKKAAEDGEKADIGVFFLRVSEIQSTVNGKGPLELVIVPRHANTYLLQQRGVFTNIREANEFFVNEGKWPSIEDILRGRSFPQLHRVTLPASEAPELLRILFDHDISPVKLQPTLDNVAASFGYTASLFEGGSRILHDPGPLLRSLENRDK